MQHRCLREITAPCEHLKCSPLDVPLLLINSNTHDVSPEINTSWRSTEVPSNSATYSRNLRISTSISPTGWTGAGGSAPRLSNLPICVGPLRTPPSCGHDAPQLLSPPTSAQERRFWTRCANSSRLHTVLSRVITSDTSKNARALSNLMRETYVLAWLSPGDCVEVASQLVSEAQPLQHGASNHAWDRQVDAAEPPELREATALKGDVGLGSLRTIPLAFEQTARHPLRDMLMRRSTEQKKKKKHKLTNPFNNDKDFVHEIAWPKTWRCANEHFSPNRQPLFRLVTQAFWRVFFTKWVIASSSGVILAGSSRQSTTGTLFLGLRVLDVFSVTLLHERIRRRIWWCQFSTLSDIVTETAIVSFHTLPVGFPLSTISKNSLYTLFCSLILDQSVLLKISISGPKILVSNVLLDTSSHHSFLFFLMNLQVIQFQHGLEFLRLSHSQFVQSFQDVIMRDFRHTQ